ncbi:ATP phosphoribosyltransferase regulatory subunit [Marinomonas agarivorans]|nr:ATP phosphoribosyltransferase regulatory subunit [Marinomonas agarivorans]
MGMADRWLLPEGVDESLPEKATQIEQLRRTLLNLHSTWGYELVIPPLLEYLDSLLIGAGSDLEIETFKVTDQLSGRLMGIRADFTSQVARIDAHSLKKSGIQRLCYCGSVLRTTPEGLDGSRSPIQFGAELYGHSGIESDVEIVSLMLETLIAAGIEKTVVDLGHVDVMSGVMEACALTDDDKATLNGFYKSKALPELKSFVDSLALPEQQKSWLIALPRLCGGEEALSNASEALTGVSEKVDMALDSLTKITKRIKSRFPQISLHFDLSDLVSYSYHTGLVFAAYVAGYGNAVARGGRYNNIGKVFGRSRPATGFSADLKTLVSLACVAVDDKKTVLAPSSEDEALWQLIRELRRKDYRVIESLTELDTPRYDYTLEQKQGAWQLVDAN